MKVRKSGYYWVKYDNQHEIAWYDNMPHPVKKRVWGYWHFCCASKEILEDGDFEWIAKRPLIAPKESHG